MQILTRVRMSLTTIVVGVALAFPVMAEYPERPVTIVAPYGPGGSSDVIGRMLAERLTEELDGNILVENRSGAGSRVGTEYVARAEADGYTLLLADMPFAIVPNLYEEAAYDVDDFVAIGQIGVAPMFLYTRPDFDGNSINDVVEAAQVEPEAVLIGSGGIGATTHMMAELFQREANIELLHVPFGGSGPSLQGLAGSQVDVAFSTYVTGASLLEAGSIKAVGVTGSDRLDVLPEVATFKESGFDLQVEHWWALLAPVDTPEEVVARLRGAVTKILEQEEVQVRLQKLSVQPGTLAPEEFQSFMISEGDRWSNVIESAGISVE